MSIGPINVGVRGFLSFLGLQAGGHNIQRLNQDLVATIDYTSFLNQTTSELNVAAAVTFAAGSAGTVQAYAAFTPPDIESYLITHLSWVVGPVAVGEYFSATPVLVTDVTTRYPIAPPFETSTTRILTVPQAAIGGAVSLVKPIIMPPRSTLGLYCSDIATAGNISARLNVRYRSLTF